jgi:hypothetical protein
MSDSDSMRHAAHAASVIDRLKRIAAAHHEQLNDVLSVYAGERLLSRLAQSSYRSTLVLQGGYLVRQWLPAGLRRTTKDIDLWSTEPRSHDQIVSVFSQIAATRDPTDAVVFDARSVIAIPIKDQGGGGFRVRVQATCGKVRLFCQADIGFDNVVIPAPEPITLPSLLDSNPSVIMSAYPVTMVIAEKFQSTIRHGMYNSRMKDYYDLAVLPMSKDIDGQSLVSSLRATFHSRATALPVDRPLSYTQAFSGADDKRRDWTNFSASMPKGLSLTLAEAADRAWAFLEEPTRCAESGQAIPLTWRHQAQQWTTAH